MLKTNTSKYQKLEEMKNKWNGAFMGKNIEYGCIKGVVTEVWITGITIESISSVRFKIDGEWRLAWSDSGYASMPKIRDIRVFDDN